MEIEEGGAVAACEVREAWGYASMRAGPRPALPVCLFGAYAMQCLNRRELPYVASFRSTYDTGFPIDSKQHEA